MITQRNQILAAAGVVLVPVLVWAATRLGDPPPPAERPRAPAAAATALVRGPELPEDVRRLLAQERNWRAARRLRELTTPRSDPELLLVAAKAEAAWGGWENVFDLLREVRESTGALSDGGIILNADNEIMWFNPAAARLLGLNQATDVGHRIDNLLRYPDFVAYLNAPTAESIEEVSVGIKITFEFCVRAMSRSDSMYRAVIRYCAVCRGSPIESTGTT